MTEDAMKVLELMGIPAIKAKAEAEAECVNMLKKGLVDCVGSDDMDCLTFGCETLIKNIKTKKDPITEVTLSKVLSGFGFTQD